MQPDFSEFSPHLFWDIDLQKMDSGDWRPFLVQRVLEYGLLEDWLKLKRLMNVKEIGGIAVQLRELEPKALSFISIQSQIPREQFRCYHAKQSIPPHWNF